MTYLEVVQHNITEIATALKNAGAESAQAEYSGSGDSGDYFEIAINGSRGQPPGDVTVKLVPDRGYFDPTDKGYQTVDKTASFDDGFEELVWQAVSVAGQDGWENNEGGGGTFTVYADGRADLDHYNNEVTENHSQHAFKGDVRASDESEET